jgi:hypothetical protein
MAVLYHAKAISLVILYSDPHAVGVFGLSSVDLPHRHGCRVFFVFLETSHRIDFGCLMAV